MRLALVCVCLCLVSGIAHANYAKRYENQCPLTARIDKAQTAISLRGVALYKQYAQDVYAGAFYSKNVLKTPEEALADRGPKRLLFSVLHSSPTLVTLIEQGLKLNNSPQTLKKEQIYISQFLNIINRTYKVGDSLALDYLPSGNTQVLLNNLPIGEIEDPEFYKYLLKMWMGRRPPSFKFQEDLFSIVNAPAIVN